MTLWQRRQLADQLRPIPLEKVLALCGDRPDRYDPRKWHAPAGVLSLNGPKFMNWTRGAGGGGAIDLVIHLRHLNFTAAVDWLAQHFAKVALEPARAPISQQPLRLPPPDPGQLRRVKEHLVQQLRIDAALLDPLLQSGCVDADNQGQRRVPATGKRKSSGGR